MAFSLYRINIPTKTKTPAKLAPLRRPVKVRRLRRFPQKMTPYGRNFFRKNLDRTPPRGREGSPFSFFYGFFFPFLFPVEVCPPLTGISSLPSA